MHIAKDGAVRKREILEAALLLFSRSGYDHTSLADIIAEVGVTKGAFYYYFSTKEDLLDTLVAELTAEEYRMVREVSTDPFRATGEVIGEILLRFASFRGYRPDRGPDLLSILDAPGNTLFRKKYLDAAADTLLPLLSDVIRRGVREGTFDTPFPGMTAGLMLTALLRFRGGISRNDLQDRESRFLQDAAERLLGAERGSLDIADRLDRLFPQRAS